MKMKNEMMEENKEIVKNISRGIIHYKISRHSPFNDLLEKKSNN